MKMEVAGVILSAEEVLYEAGKWPIISSQIFGFLPLSSVKTAYGYKLDLCKKKFTYAKLFSIIQLALSIIFPIFFTFAMDWTNSSFGGEETTNSAYNIWSCCQYILLGYVNIDALLWREKTHQLWQNLVGFYGNLISLSMLNPEFEKSFMITFEKVSRKCKVRIVFYLLVTTIAMISFLPSSTNILKEKSRRNLHVKSEMLEWGSFFVSFYTFIHPLYTSFICYIMQTLKCAADFVAREIKSQETQMISEVRMRQQINSLLQLEELVKEFSHRFGEVFLVTSLLTALTISITMFFVSTFMLFTSTRLDTVIISIVPISMYIWSIVSLCQISSAITETIESIGQSLENSIAHESSVQFCLQIQMVGTRLATKPPTIGKYMLVNISLVLNIIGVLGTFMIILLQFRQSELGSTMSNIMPSEEYRL